MTWFPAGPDFVFAPRNSTYLRVSRRNELGRQAAVRRIAIDPNDRNTIYIAVRPWWDSWSAFRTRDGGTSWFAIADSIQQVRWNADPAALAVNPAHPEVIYLGTADDRGVYVSNDRGDTWSARSTIAGRVRQLLIDPRTAANAATTVLYAATDAGIWRSADGGRTWPTCVLAEDTWSMTAFIPQAGTAHFYAGVWKKGVYHASDPAQGPPAWANLSDLGIGLPKHVATIPSEPDGNFNGILIDFCRLAPNRVYAWHFKWQFSPFSGPVTAGLYTTAAPTQGPWTLVAMTPPPGGDLPRPDWGWHAYAFAVAPNSPGDGQSDILFFGRINLVRSVDGGRTWSGDVAGYGPDYHAFAFFQEESAPGVIPAIYMGSDAGIGVNTRFADPAFPFSAPTTAFNDGLVYDDTSGVSQNIDHARQSVALTSYASDPSAPAAGYVGCVDTGIAAGGSGLTWRCVARNDVFAVATATASDGMKVWGLQGIPNTVRLWTDRGSFEQGTATVPVTAPGGVSVQNSTSNYVAALDKTCLAGLETGEALTTLAAAAGPGQTVARPVSMARIVVGVTLDVQGEWVTVAAVTATTFTANFTGAHAAGASVRLVRYFVARIDQSGLAVPISQDFLSINKQLFGHAVHRIAVSPFDPDVLWCSTEDQRLWFTNAGSTASGATQWTEVTANKPPGAAIADIAIDFSGNVNVLLESAVTVASAAGPVTTPLFRIVRSNWTPQPVAQLPGTDRFDRLKTDPVAWNALYATREARVYRVTPGAGAAGWQWQDISDGLPGAWHADLWVGNIAPAGTLAKVILRAAVPSRGVWERDVTPGAADPPVALYVRDNILDSGWLTPSPDGVPNPWRPAERVYHYQCTDIKIDPGESGFYETEPEHELLPIDHVTFDELNDADQLWSGDTAWVHVQVHNRSRTPANCVTVWAIYSQAAAGVPALNTSAAHGNNFAFWDQFKATGEVVPALPVDSPWKSLGPPQAVMGVDAFTPKIVSWKWDVPPGVPRRLSSRYALVVFVHSALAPVNEYRMNVDAITPTNRQVGQRSIQIFSPWWPIRTQTGDSAIDVIDFVNSDPHWREVSLVFDLQALPATMRTSVRFTPLESAGPLAISGAAVARATLLETTLENLRSAVTRIADWQYVLGLGLQRLGARLSHRRAPPGYRGTPETGAAFEERLYRAQPSALVTIRGVRLPPHGRCAALISFTGLRTLAADTEYRYEVQQRVAGDLAGGCSGHPSWTAVATTCDGARSCGIRGSRG